MGLSECFIVEGAVGDHIGGLRGHLEINRGHCGQKLSGASQQDPRGPAIEGW